MQNVSLLYQLKFSLEIATQGKLVGKTSLLLVISMFPAYNKYIYMLYGGNVEIKILV